MSFNQKEYIDKTASLPHRDILETVIDKLEKRTSNIAVDCGCGNGNDIQFLLDCGFYVYGFDNEPAAIEACRKRFSERSSISLTQKNFETFEYPQADIIYASRSLFFCEQQELLITCEKIIEALSDTGVFCGDFLGEEDEWIKGGRPVSFTSKKQLEAIFAELPFFKCKEVKRQGKTVNGKEKFWHTYTVIAAKN